VKQTWNERGEGPSRRLKPWDDPDTAKNQPQRKYFDKPSQQHLRKDSRRPQGSDGIYGKEG
jgi:hypothetical protein